MASERGVLLVLLALLAAAAATSSRLVVTKGCDVDEELDASGSGCAKAEGVAYAPARRGDHSNALLPPLDPAWLRRLLPLGIRSNSVDEVWLQITPTILQPITKLPMESSSKWNEIKNNSSWHETVVLEGQKVLLRNEITGKTLRTVMYYIGAAQNSSKSFAVIVQSYCSRYIYRAVKCCPNGHVLAQHEGKLTCYKEKAKDVSNVSEDLYLETGISCQKSCTMRWEANGTDFCINHEVDMPGGRRINVWRIRLRKAPQRTPRQCSANGPSGEARLLLLSLPAVGDAGAAGGGAGGHRVQRSPARVGARPGARLARRLPAPLQRGQAVFLLTTFGEMGDLAFIPTDKKESCLLFAFASYFFLVAAASWLTAVSLNMTTGFRVRHGRRAGARSERRSFLWLCAGAWGLPVVLTSAAIIAFYAKVRPLYASSLQSVLLLEMACLTYTGPWYLPSFVETRTCFTDIVHSKKASW